MRLLLATSSEPRPDFLGLPFDTPLDDWPDALVVDIPTGVHRHPVRFVGTDDRLFALKELPGRLADHEWHVLRRIAADGIPAVEAVGVVHQRGDGLDDVLITRHLDYSMPVRLLLARSRLPRFRDHLIDAMAALVVRLHLVGCFWGDCSLSNTLFRRDAGALSAYVVDVETAELHPSLTDGQRTHELDLMEVNVLGGLSDLEAERGLPPDLDPVDVARTLRRRYEELWAELTAEDVVPEGERWRIDERLRRLNALGFDTDEIELSSDGDRSLRFRPAVVEAGHHRRRLRQLTGVEAQENQARRLLNDMASYRVYVEQRDAVSLPEAVAAYRWLHEVYEAALAEIPDHLRDRRDAAELFHEVLAHRDALRDRDGVDIRVPEAAADFARAVLPGQPAERTVLDEDPVTDDPIRDEPD
jgi:hypothetical protein